MSLYQNEENEIYCHAKGRTTLGRCSGTGCTTSFKYLMKGEEVEANRYAHASNNPAGRAASRKLTLKNSYVTPPPCYMYMRSR